MRPDDPVDWANASPADIFAAEDLKRQRVEVEGPNPERTMEDRIARGKQILEDIQSVVMRLHDQYGNIPPLEACIGAARHVLCRGDWTVADKAVQKFGESILTMVKQYDVIIVQRAVLERLHRAFDAYERGQIGTALELAREIVHEPALQLPPGCDPCILKTVEWYRAQAIELIETIHTLPMADARTAGGAPMDAIDERITTRAQAIELTKITRTLPMADARTAGGDPMTRIDNSVTSALEAIVPGMPYSEAACAMLAEWGLPNPTPFRVQTLTFILQVSRAILDKQGDESLLSPVVFRISQSQLEDVVMAVPEEIRYVNDGNIPLYLWLLTTAAGMCESLEYESPTLEEVRQLMRSINDVRKQTWPMVSPPSSDSGQSASEPASISRFSTHLESAVEQFAGNIDLDLGELVSQLCAAAGHLAPSPEQIESLGNILITLGVDGNSDEAPPLDTGPVVGYIMVAAGEIAQNYCMQPNAILDRFIATLLAAIDVLNNLGAQSPSCKPVINVAGTIDRKSRSLEQFAERQVRMAGLPMSS
jgi:hypothetical protein